MLKTLLKIAAAFAISSAAWAIPVYAPAGTANGSSTSGTVANIAVGNNTLVVIHAAPGSAAATATFAGVACNIDNQSGSAWSGSSTLYTFSCFVASATTGNAVVSWSGTHNYVIAVSTITGLISSPLDQIQTNSSASGTTSPSSNASPATTQAIEIAIGAVAMAGSSIGGAWSNSWTDGQSAVQSTIVSLSEGYSILSAIGPQTAAKTGTASHAFAANVVTYKAVVSVPIIYVDGAVLQLDSGKSQVTILDSGALGGSQTISCPASASQTCEIRFYLPGDFSYVLAGGNVLCHDPCTALINTEYGKVGYFYSINNASDVPFSPPLNSARQYLAQTQAPATTGPWGVPITVHGFKDYTTAPFAFPISAGADLSGGLRIWLWTFNLRNGVGAVVANDGTEHLLKTVHLIKLTNNGAGLCSGTSITPHGFSVGTKFQLNTRSGGSSGDQSQALNALWTAATVPTTTTFTFACSGIANTLIAGTNGGIGQPIAGMDFAVNVSSSMFYSDEMRWNGGIESTHQAVRVMVPVGAQEFTAGVTNTLALRFKDTIDPSITGLTHGWYARWELINGPDVVMDQIVVSGLTATAHTTTAMPASWATGDTVLIQDAPGPQWRFNDLRVITLLDSTHFTFAWGPDVVNLGEPGETANVFPFLTPAGTYIVPQTRDALNAPQPVMRVAHALVPKSSFTAPSLPSLGGNALNGQNVYLNSVLKEPNASIPNNQSIATCQSSLCHTNSVTTVSDLKYFGFSEYVTVVAGIRRGLSESDSKDLAAFLSSNSVQRPPKGHPWNSPFQPGPGLDSNPIQNWSAGAGEEWRLTYDNDLCEFMVPGAFPPECAGGNYAAWAPNANPRFNMRETPIMYALPHWMQWLTRTSPLDFYHYLNDAATLTSINSTNDFTTSPLDTNYQSWLTSFGPVFLTADITAAATSIPVTDASKLTNSDFIQFSTTGEFAKITAGGSTAGPHNITVLRAQKSTSAAAQSNGAFVSDFTAYGRKRNSDDGAFFSESAALQLNHGGAGPSYLTAVSPDNVEPNVGAGSGHNAWQYPSQYGNMYFDMYPWTDSRLWELTQSFWLQNMCPQVYQQQQPPGVPDPRASPQYTRCIYNPVVFITGPHKSAGGAEKYFFNTGSYNNDNWNRFTAMWYHLSPVLDAGDDFKLGNLQQDDPYYDVFSSHLSDSRPGFYHHAFLRVFEAQNTWGWSTLAGMQVVSTMNMSQQFGQGGATLSDQFMSEARKTEVATQIATNMLAIFNTFSVPTWQSFWAADITHIPSRAELNNASGISNSQGSGAAYSLPILHFWGVPQTLIDQLANEFNLIYATINASSGHDFAVDAAAPCSYVKGNGTGIAKVVCP